MADLSNLRLLLVLLVISSSLALQLPFHIPFFTSKAPVLSSTQDTPRIAIVGAGAAGSSAAFWISRVKERFGLEVEVDVYERSLYVGGRSTIVHPYDNTSLPAIELGASIFIENFKNMWRASKEFNLTRHPFTSGGWAIWNGNKFVLTLERDGSFLDKVKVLWRYGPLAPRRTVKLVESMVDKFMVLYTPDSPKWDTISNLSSALGWTELTAQTTAEYFETHGVSKKFTREMVEAATRINYAQNVDKIHALGGGCTLATEQAHSIQGGNWRIFDQFIKRSGANIRLNTAVLSIKPKNESSALWTVKSGAGSADYKGVIIATPFHSSSIELLANIASQIPPQPYVHLHVTLLTTISPMPNPRYFGLRAGSKLPTTILTSFEGVRRGGEEPEFYSLMYLNTVLGDESRSEWVVRIRSKERISDHWLHEMFGQVGWVHRKEWDAYPYLPPTTKFPPVKLDLGLYYVNAFEPFISTMETETIASRNVVDLLLDELFGFGICGPAPEVRNRDEDFVLGWDC